MRASEVTIKSIMTKDILCIDSETPLTEAGRTMASGMVSCVMIVDQNEPVGIITERDLALVMVGVVDPQLLQDMPVSEVTGDLILTIKDSETLHNALELVDRVQIRHLPVVDDVGKLVGIVTQSDLLRACRKLLE